MIVYVVLYDRPIGYNDYCETEVVRVCKHEQDAIEFANIYHCYRVQAWYVTGA